MELQSSLALALVLLLGKSSNILILFGFGIYRNWGTFHDFANSYLNPTIVIDSVKTAAALFVFLQLTRYILGLKQLSSSSNEFPVKPLCFPCQTSHVRMFPTKHGFSYSYLVTGIPVGWTGSAGGMISTEARNAESSWYSRLFSLGPWGVWYTVNGDDYLDRGHVPGGLQGKLRSYLESQNIAPSDYPHAYLVTAARFLNYASNPLSVWYLYSSTKELTALILEVNNTFDERRVYFLKPDRQSTASGESTRYTGTWPKDFYVSVFNDRAGAYSLAAYDPFAPNLSSPGHINTTITLSSPSGKAKLIARLNSTSSAIDPSTLSLWQKTVFLLSWWWVGLATFPRTIQQALIILLRVKLPWVFRPEPRGTTIPRHADETETLISSLFLQLLRERVAQSPSAIKVLYKPAGLVDTAVELILSPSAQLSPSSAEEVDVTVLTPIFYSRLVQYPDLLSGILTEHQSNTVSVSNPSGCLDLLSTPVESAARYTYLERIAFTLLSLFRSPPARIVCAYEENTAKDINLEEKHDGNSNGCDFAAFILQTGKREQKREFLRSVLRLLLANWVAFGWVEILDLEVWMLKCVVLWGVAGRVF